MKEILIFAGTTEGRRLSEILSKEKIKHTICVATKYGEEVLESTPYLTVNCDRMDEAAMRDFLKEGNFSAVFDATHPYAKEVTKNIKEAAKETSVPYYRIKRNTDASDTSNIRFFSDVKECAKALCETKGNILLTTGSKDLREFVSEVGADRIYARVIPGEESIAICDECGIKGRHVIAMQGPFSLSLNEALIDEFNISVIVSKQSGATGGFDEKIEAAKIKKISAFVIGCEDEDGISIKEACEEIGKITGTYVNLKNKINISLAGIGPGAKSVFTREVTDAVNNADILMGADRMLENFRHSAKVYPYYRASEIVPFIESLLGEENLKEETNIVILFSGDSSFYSGATSLYRELLSLKEKNGSEINIDILPGISSLSYMCSKLGLTMQDVNVISLHGKEVTNLALRIKPYEKTFMLLSGVKDVNRIGKCLLEAHIECDIYLGSRLSYEDEKISILSAKDCLELQTEGLYSCVIVNKYPESKAVSHGMSDDEFIRGKVPMSKEEVREVSICKLGLKCDSVLYDIGSGTGSVAVECALLSNDLTVYAIECKDEALELIEANKKRFLLENIEIVKAVAPEGLKDLKKATHAFIGGSRGNLKEILENLKEINPDMRVVINAVSLETIGELSFILKEFEGAKADIVQLQVSRSDEVGSYHLMRAQNPVYICTVKFR